MAAVNLNGRKKAQKAQKVEYCFERCDLTIPILRLLRLFAASHN
jgi:hypothetical protein